TEDHSLENALFQLEEEQQRCESLAEVNTLLREHLDKANEVNSALKEDVGKLTADWMRAREELELKENEWRNEREFYDSYLKGEHNRLLSLWRQVVTFRRHFLEMKTATDRDLSELKAEQMRLSGSILVNCFRLNSGVQLWESLTLGRPVIKDQAQKEVEKEINQKTSEVMGFQVKGDFEKKELQDKVMELSALLVQSQKQNEEKEKTMKTLNDTVEILVCFTFIWEIAQCLLGLSGLFSSLSTKRCGFFERNGDRNANCMKT
uniref:Rootletin-like coiled-coil domain-containing protein n=1 Tax=Apteryx owenii TaxID=8824 RepID=A0A8B9SCR2_APTOW